MVYAADGHVNLVHDDKKPTIAQLECIHCIDGEIEVEDEERSG